MIGEVTADGTRVATRIAHRYAKRIHGAGPWVDDLRSAALEGLLRAAAPSSGSREAYAATVMRHAVDDEWRKISHYRRSDARPALSLDQAVEAEDAEVLRHFVAESAEDTAIRSLGAVDIADAADQLPERWRVVFHCVYTDGAKKQDVAAELGVTPSRISQILAQIAGRLTGLFSPDQEE